MAIRWYFERLRQNLKISPDGPWHVVPRQVKFPLSVHRGASSDLRVFEQIFVDEEYACLRTLENVAVIVDLGANVGYSSAYFLSAFPTSKCLAVEPSPSTFERMSSNLAPYGRSRVIAVLGAAWSERTRVSLVVAGSEWANRVEEPSGAASPMLVEAYDIPSLLDMTSTPIIDLLKVDIEGGEVFIFNKSASAWLPRIRNICIELHGPECRAAFFAALTDFDYELSHRGELTICRNLRQKVASQTS